MTIDLKMEGALKLSEQLRALALPRREKRKLHLWIADAVARRMKKDVREFVNASPLKLFDGSASTRKRQARFFASQVGRRATADNGVVFDRRSRPKRARKSEAATDEQAARMKELGFRRSKKWIKQRFSFRLAGLVIRKMETAAGVTAARRSRRSRFREGSLLLLVWRERGEEIVTAVDPVKIIRGFLRARLAAA